jgi:uncharacterized protein (TIGR00369 family)
VPAELPDGFVRIPFDENPFVHGVGPLYGQREEGRAGRLVLGARVERRHCSPSGYCHGGMLMTMADMLVVIGANLQADQRRFMTTVRLSADFLAAVPLGAWLEGRLEVLRVTRNLIFCQGMLRVAGEPVLRPGRVSELVARPALALLAPALAFALAAVAAAPLTAQTGDDLISFVNGKLFAHDKGGAPTPMFSPKLNTVEEWLLVNDSPEWHNFHIHVDPYQVVARNGRPVTGQPEWADSLAMPPYSRITIRQRFADFTGRFVFHCHVLVHEDKGMMAEVRVVP